MKKLLGAVGAFVGGSIGWWAGSGIGMMTAFLASIAGTAAGVYLAARVARDWL